MNYGSLSLWFFRDLTDDQRDSLLRVAGLPVGEGCLQSEAQRRGLKKIVEPDALAAPAGCVVVPVAYVDSKELQGMTLGHYTRVNAYCDSFPGSVPLYDETLSPALAAAPKVSEQADPAPDVGEITHRPFGRADAVCALDNLREYVQNADTAIASLRGVVVDHARIVAEKDAEIRRLTPLFSTRHFKAKAEAAEQRAEALAGLLRECAKVNPDLPDCIDNRGCTYQSLHLAETLALTGQATPEGAS